jgi:hypothetical protein
MMVLLAGEPSGKAGSLCKRFLRALISENYVVEEASM